MKTKVCVTRKDIKNGKKDRASCCAIALAASRTFGCPVRVTDCINTLRGNVYHLPIKARDFIKRFDDGQAVKPFSFWTL